MNVAGPVGAAEGTDAAAVPLGTIRQAVPSPLESDGVPVADMWQGSLALAGFSF